MTSLTEKKTNTVKQKNRSEEQGCPVLPRIFTVVLDVNHRLFKYI